MQVASQGERGAGRGASPKKVPSARGKKFGFRCNTDMDTQDEANIVLTWCSSLSCGDLASPFIRSMDLYVYIYGRQQAMRYMYVCIYIYICIQKWQLMYHIPHE